MKKIALFLFPILLDCTSQKVPAVLPDENNFRCLHADAPILNRKVFVDEKFSVHEFGIISDSLEAWHRITDGNVNYVLTGHFQHIDLSEDPISPTNDSVYIYYSSINSQFSIKYYPQKYAVGSAGSIVLFMDEITIMPGDFDRKLKGITMHEIGHTLGIGHIQEPHALMYPNCKLACIDPQITMYDMSAFCNAANDGYHGFIPEDGEF